MKKAGGVSWVYLWWLC